MKKFKGKQQDLEFINEPYLRLLVAVIKQALFDSINISKDNVVTINKEVEIWFATSLLLELANINGLAILKRYYGKLDEFYRNKGENLKWM